MLADPKLRKESVMPEAKIPSKKTIRKKLKRQRRRVGGLKLVTPNEQLASLLGPAPRPRKELARHLHAYAQECGLVDPLMHVVRANAALVKLFWGRDKIRESDLLKVVTCAVLPGGPTVDLPDPEPEPVTEFALLPAEPIIARRDPEQEGEFPLVQ
jgi:hypothetical protein